MADSKAGFILEFDTSDFESGGNAVIKVIDKIDKAQDDLNDSLSKSFDKAIDAQEKYQKEVKKTASANDDLAKTQKSLSTEVKGGESSLKRWINGLKDGQSESKKLTADRVRFLRTFSESKTAFKDELKNFQFLGTSIGRIGNLWSSLITVGRSWIKVLGLTKIAIAGTGIGLLLIALGALYAQFQKTQEGLDFVNKAFAVASEVVSTFIDSLSSVGAGLVKLLQGDFSAAVDEFRGAGEELAGIGGDVQAAWNLEGAAQALVKEQIALRREIATTRAEVKELNKIAEDVTKSTAEREAAAKRAGEIESGILEKRIALENENIRIIEEKNALGKNLNADEEALTEAIEQRSAVQQESLELQTTLNNKLNVIRADRLRQIEAEKARVKELTDEYVNQLNTLAGQLQQLELDEADPVTKLNLQREIAIQALEEQRGKLLELAQQLGKPVEEINSQFDTLVDAQVRKFDDLIEEYTSQFARLNDVPQLDTISGLEIEKPDVSGTLEAIQEIQNKLNSLSLTASQRTKLEGELQELEALVENSVPQITIKVDTDFDTASGDFQNFADETVAFFNSDDFKAGSFAFDQLTNAASTLFEGAIENLERLADERQESIDRLQNDLEREEELYELGLANNVGAKREELNGLIAEQEEYNKRANELRKKQIEVETAASLAQTTAAGIAAVAQAFQAHSGIPFVGVALAVGYAATIIAQIAKARQQIKSLYTGAERISDHFGYAQKGGPTDMPGRGSRGLALVDAGSGQDTGVRISGNEGLVTESTYAKIGHIINDAENDPTVIKKLNDWYNGVSQSDIGLQQGASRVNNIVIAQESSISKKDMKVLMSEVIREQTQSQINYDKNKKTNNTIEQRRLSSATKWE